MRGSIRPCTPCCPGSWSRADPPSRPSGATCQKTTTWTATLNCRRCSLTYTPVRNIQVSPTYLSKVIVCIYHLLKFFGQNGMLQVPEVRRNCLKTQKHLTSRRGATRTERQTHTICNLSIMPRQAMEQVISHNASPLTLISN